MPTLPHLLFAAAVAVLIAIAMVLLLPGRDAVGPQEAHIVAPAGSSVPSFSN